MSTGLPVFDTSIQETNVWLTEVGDRLDLSGRQDQYVAVRAALHALRDRLPADMVLALSAQLPMLMRGLFLEGWRPVDGPSNERTVEAFSDRIEKELPAAFPHSGAVVARAVFRVLGDQVGWGLPEKLAQHLPEQLRDLWPERIVTSESDPWSDPAWP